MKHESYDYIHYFPTTADGKASSQDRVTEDESDSSWTNVQRMSRKDGHGQGNISSTSAMLLPTSTYNHGLSLGILQDLLPHQEELWPHLSERLKSDRYTTEAKGLESNNRLLNGVREYFRQISKSEEAVLDTWQRKTEFPTAAEILDEPLERKSQSAAAPEIPQNLIKGCWSSKEEYLRTHYELLREDLLKRLKGVVAELRGAPDLAETDFRDGAMGIYGRVFLKGITYSNLGIGLKIVFSLCRVGKMVLWSQSKRLMSGSLVVLSPVKDMFNTKCVVATIAARPLSGLELDPPEIDIFIPQEEDIFLDPTEEWIMVEDRGAYYEAGRHTLVTLQKMTTERFPFQEHLLSLKKEVEAPEYVLRNPIKDLRSIINNTGGVATSSINILNEWPSDVDIGMDPSQKEALKRMLTKRVAIVQGPPGTGKTYVSVKAISLLLANWSPGDPPIIITGQTNHALDQILRLIAEFESNFVRLGGQSKDKDVIKKQTLYAIRESRSQNPGAQYRSKGAAIRRLRQIANDMQELLSQLYPNDGAVDESSLRYFGVLSEAQISSLEAKTDDDWVDHELSNANWSIESWLGAPLVEVPTPYKPDYLREDYEDPELFSQMEPLNEEEADAGANDDKEFSLKGPVSSISKKYAAKELATATNPSKYVTQQDLGKVPRKERGSLYNFLVQKAKTELTRRFHDMAKKYNRESKEYKISRFEEDVTILKGAKVIGVTTTGLGKYRPMLSALSPKIILVEEAAETIESYVAVACVPSLEHLILVGDHQQLRPHCNVREFEGDPYNLNISMFERLVGNEIEYGTIRRQRRMIPEIRRLIGPIYGSVLKDNPLVKDQLQRPPVPAMGGCNSFFFHHEWQEIRDDYMSSCNRNEADMIVGFTEHLVLNGVPMKDVTILTFYNGQRKLITRLLATSSILVSFQDDFRVATVDSYQGEENEVILLSLVRNNDHYNIGFLSNCNRVCVALSRARRGLYIFGNAKILASENKLWRDVIKIIWGKEGKYPPSEPKRRIGFYLPIQCTTHGRKVFVDSPHQWESLSGGCDMPCGETLYCGHVCKHKCHPFDHNEVCQCEEHCLRFLSCGHRCSRTCSESCYCIDCSDEITQADVERQTQRGLEERLGNSAVSERWQEYASEGVKLHDQEQEKIAKRNARESRLLTPKFNETIRITSKTHTVTEGGPSRREATATTSPKSARKKKRHHNKKAKTTEPTTPDRCERLIDID